MIVSVPSYTLSATGVTDTVVEELPAGIVTEVGPIKSLLNVAVPVL